MADRVPRKTGRISLGSLTKGGTKPLSCKENTGIIGKRRKALMFLSKKAIILLRQIIKRIRKP